MSLPSIFSFAILQILGLFVITMSVVMISKRVYYTDIILNLKANNPLIFVSAMILLLIGISLVYVHNIWIINHKTSITVFVWCILMLALFWLMMPERMLNLTQRVASSTFGFCSFFVFAFFFGFVMLGRGTFLFIVHHIYQVSH